MYKKAIIILFFILLISPTYASVINNNDIILSLDKDGVTHANITLDYDELTTNKVYFLIFAMADNLVASDINGGMNCELQYLSYGTQIACDPNIFRPQNYKVNLLFDVYGLQRKSNLARIFTYDYSVKDPTKKLKVKLLLPSGAALVETTDIVTPYSPKDGVLGSTGRQISIEWKNDNLELGKTYSFNAIFEMVDVTSGIFNYKPLLLVLFIIIVILIYLRTKSEKETIMSILKDDEKTVMNIILEYNGKCRQKDIVKRTDLSKATVSRIVSSLEERGLLKKERRGRTNIIQLVNKNVKS